MQLLPMLVTALQESEQSQLLKKYGATLAKHTETASTLLDMLNLVLDDKARLNKNSYLAGTGRAMAVRSEVNGLLDMSRWPIFFQLYRSAAQHNMYIGAPQENLCGVQRPVTEVCARPCSRVRPALHPQFEVDVP